MIMLIGRINTKSVIEGIKGEILAKRRERMKKK